MAEPALADARLASPPRWRAWLLPLVAVGLVSAAMAGRATLEQLGAYERAIEAERREDLDLAISEYRWVLRWSTPWGPRDGAAAAALVRIADAAEASRPERAAFALDALRSGLIAARWLLQPRAELLESANARLPELQLRVAERRGDRRDRGGLQAQLRRDYARPVGVPGWLSLMVGCGFLLWLAGMYGAWVHGVADDGGPRRGAWPWAVAAMTGFATWGGALLLG